jgi:hypothetical protein
VFFGWVFYDTRLSMVEISGFNGRLLQREVLGECECLHAPITAFSTHVSFGFCLGFYFIFCSQSAFVSSIVIGLFIDMVARLAHFFFI